MTEYKDDQLKLFETTQEQTLKQYDKSIKYCLDTRNYKAMIVLAKKANAIQNQTLDTLIF